MWGKTIKATNYNNGYPSNNNQPKSKLMKAIKNTRILFTQFGVNEPTSGGERSPFHYQSFLILDYNEIYKSCKNLEFS